MWRWPTSRAPEVIETFIVSGSTRIRSVEYEDTTDDLSVTFTDDRTYVYHNVPKSTYRGLTLASSKGQFFDRWIKNAFPYDEV